MIPGPSELGAAAGIAMSLARHAYAILTLGFAAIAAGWLSPQDRRAGRVLPCLLGPLLAAGLFAGLAAGVESGQTAELDRAIAVAVHRLDSGPMEQAMRLLSFIGSVPVQLLIVAALFAWAWRSRDRRAALILAGGTAVSQGLNAALKLAFHRPRPSLFPIEVLHGYSFPSDHAMGSVAVFGLCAAAVVRLRPSLLRPLALLTAALALLIGLSRVFLGVHWPTDVLAGYAAGAFILLLGLRALCSFAPGPEGAR